PVRHRWSREHRAVVGGQRVVRRDHVRADADQDVDDDDGRTERAQGTLAAELPDRREPPVAPGRLGDLGGDVDGATDRHYRNLIRGSSQASVRSTRKVTTMKTNATS